MQRRNIPRKGNNTVTIGIPDIMAKKAGLAHEKEDQLETGKEDVQINKQHEPIRFHPTAARNNPKETFPGGNSPKRKDMGKANTGRVVGRAGGKKGVSVRDSSKLLEVERSTTPLTTTIEGNNVCTWKRKARNNSGEGICSGLENGGLEERSKKGRIDDGRHAPIRMELMEIAKQSRQTP